MSDELADSGRDSESPVSGSESIVEPAGNRRRLVEIRCGFAEMARKEAEAAEARAREARQVSDEQADGLAPLLAAVDPAATKASKERAHGAFRSTVGAARSRAQVETAANVWLQEINEINSQHRAAQARVKRDRETVDALRSQADKLEHTAESARAMADVAAEACRIARQTLARIGEPVLPGPVVDQFGGGTTQPAAEVTVAPVTESALAGSVGTSAAASIVAGATSAPAASSPAIARARRTLADAPAPEEPDERSPADWLMIDLRAPHPQAIVRLLRRDDRTMNSLVEHLASTEPSAQSPWRLLLSNFVDSVVAAAIDDAWFEFPPGNPFWDQFTSEQAREVARGLAALGFRYDGFGAFADGRIPSQRDLALAVGSTDLLPARVRNWPRPEEAAELYETVRVATDSFIAVRAPTLTLGELVNLLGRRSELLADLWNDWQRVRPHLFSTE